MSRWKILVSHRHRSDSLTDLVEHARELPTDEDRATLRQLVIGEIVGGSDTTAGELLDRVEKAAPGERRKMLDAARVKAGLPTTGDVEFREHFRRVQHSARPEAGNEHRPMRLGYTETGAIIDLNERDDDIAREQLREESRRKLREEQQAARAIEAEALRENERARDAAFRSELPPRGARVTTEELCRHEAGHACAAALLGLSVRLVDTTTRHELTPGGGLCTIFGEVRHSGEQIIDRDSARRRMLVILCGPIDSADSWRDVPHWPLDEDAETTDERNLWALVDWLGFDRADYHEVVTDAIELTLTDEYRLLHQAVTGLLDYVHASTLRCSPRFTR